MLQINEFDGAASSSPLDNYRADILKIIRHSLSNKAYKGPAGLEMLNKEIIGVTHEYEEGHYDYTGIPRAKQATA